MEEPKVLRSPIPKAFLSDLTGEPLSHCMVCEAELLKSGTPYIIEKSFKVYRGELTATNTIFEFVMCIWCAMQTRNSLSKQSLEAMERFMKENGNLQGRSEKLLAAENPDPELWLNHCLVSGAPADDLEEFQICGQFQGSEMICSEFPFLISGPVMDQMAELMSPETLDELDRFTREHVNGPPELAELLDRPLLVF